MNWYLKVVRDNYANFSGRAQRVEYWMFVLINVVISVVLSIVEQTAGLTTEPDAFGNAQGFLTPIYSLIVLIPSMAVTIRRLHDVGKSGWWILIALTCIGVIPLLIWYISEGTPGDNQYGPNPREIDGPAPVAEDETGQAEDETGQAEDETGQAEDETGQAEDETGQAESEETDEEA